MTAGAPPAGTGALPTSTSALLDSLGRRYAAASQAAIGSAAALTAPFTGAPLGATWVALISGAFVLWNATFLVLMLRDDRTWYWLVNVAFVVALCLAQSVTVDPADQLNGSGWTTVVASIAVMAVQWHVRSTTAFAVTTTIVVATVAGAAWSREVTVVQALLPTGAWMLVEAALSRLLWRMVRRGGRIADDVLCREFSLRRETATAAARRRDERAHWSALHDTSATTLLMIGLGEVRGDEPWLGPQVRRDLDALRGSHGGARDVDLVVELAATVARARLDAMFDPPEPVPVPGPVALALAGATGEALENVRRHAGVSGAKVLLNAEDGTVRVVVTDAGRGFDPALLPTGRYGLSRSILERVREAGGSAEVVSQIGAGTTVRLEWRHA